MKTLSLEIILVSAAFVIGIVLINIIYKKFKPSWLLWLGRIIGIGAYAPLFINVWRFVFEGEPLWLFSLIWWPVLFSAYLCCTFLIENCDWKFNHLLLGFLVLLPLVISVQFLVLHIGEGNIWQIILNVFIFMVSLLILALFLVFLVFSLARLKRIQYDSVSSNLEKTATLSGLLILPGWRCGKLPIMCFQHSTEILKKFVPSRPWAIALRNLAELFIAACFAVFGKYTVVMADYQGMGDDKAHDQPYNVAEPLAQSVVDALRHVKKEYDKTNNPKGKFTWNQELFLTGYSEGGFVTMAAARKLKKDYPEEFKITACAPLGGTYSLSDVIRHIMVDDMPYTSGNLIPMIIRGFHARYENTKWEKHFTRDTFRPGYGIIWDYCDGYHPTGEVGKLMPRVPRLIFRKDILNQLETEGSEVYNILCENDAFHDWPDESKDIEVNRTRMNLYHAIEDDVVPFRHAAIAFEELKKRGLEINLNFVEPLCFPCIGVHLQAAIPCFKAAGKWFKKIRKGSPNNQ
jgi:hypothetical protein